MTDTTNGLTLSGTIDRVETTKRVKAKQSYQEDKGGELKLTVLVSRPVAPKRRSVALWGLPDDSPLREMASDYGIDDDALDNVSDDDIAAEIARLQAVEQPKKKRITKKMSDEEREAAQAHNDSLDEAANAYKEAQQGATQLGNYQKARADYTQQLAEYAPAFRQFAAMTAMGLMLEGEQVVVTLQPDSEAMTQMFPELSALTAAIEGSAETLPLD